MNCEIKWIKQIAGPSVPPGMTWIFLVWHEFWNKMNLKLASLYDKLAGLSVPPPFNMEQYDQNNQYNNSSLWLEFWNKMHWEKYLKLVLSD